MHKEVILGESIFLIHDFLSPEECEHLIAASERTGYEEASINTLYGPQLRPEVRDNMRVILDDDALAAEWFHRAAPLLPNRIGKWEVIGLNERFRYYRYDPSQSFKRHYDGSYSRRNGDTSLLTFMVYLNDGYVGGNTEFYHPNDKPKASVSPKRGAALVFEHLQVHEGAAVEEGRKYVLRTDVMYTRKPR